MSDVDAVIDLLERWRDATGMGRLRIGVDASRVIADLPAERKRALAIEVADRVAPQLVPAIQSESGDLTAEQIGAVVDLLRRADREQLDDLVTALRTGDVGGAAALVGDAVDVIAPEDPAPDELLEDIATEDEPVGDAPAPPTVVAPAPPTVVADAPDADPGDVSPGDADHDDEPRDEPDDEGRGTTVETSAAAAAAMAEHELVEVTADGDIEFDEEAVRQRLEEEARARAEQYRDTSSDLPDVPAYRAPPVDFTSDLDLPDTDVESVPTLHQRMAADTARGRLAAPPVSQVVASLTATADGYRRRRDALRAIRDGRLEAADVAAVVRSFARGTDRSWVAGAAIDAGLLAPGDLEGLGLPASAIARLERRAH